MNRRSMMRISALLLLAITAGTTPAMASDEPQAMPSAPGAPIVGSWFETTTVPGIPPFAGLLTFERGGTLVASYQGNVDARAAFTAAHGRWVHEGGRAYSTTAVQLVSDLSGNLLFLNKLRQRIVLSQSGDSYSSVVRAEFSDPVTGAVIFAAQGTTEARRIDAEPLP